MTTDHQERTMLKDIRLDELSASLTNPRKTFEQVKLDELARSVAEKGVLEPLLVRPRRPSPPWTKEAKVNYEIVAGERRFRAATIAQLETVPCIVRELSDVEALEVQTIENLQRDDLHPLEEAEGYAALMKEAGYDVAQIAQRIGKSEKYVYDRLKLLQLIPALKEVFLGGEISIGHAILLARLSPTDQERANGSGTSGARLEGLWAHDSGHQEYGLELDDARRRKPVSVRELDTWINNHVRFDPKKEDLPALFPETAVALDAAEEEELKVIKITRDYQLRPETRGSGERTYSRRSWKRADGQPDQEPWERKKAPPSKECEHSVMGVVVAGPGRGDAFRVCIAKKKCKAHWGEEMKEKERRAKSGTISSGARDNWQEQQRRREERHRKDAAERERWKKAEPKLLEALATKLKTTPALDLADLLLDKVKPYGAPAKSKLMERGTTLDDAVRLAAFHILSARVTGWSAAQEAPKAMKKYGINAEKIVDQVAPKAKAEKPAKKKAKKADPKKPGARTRRRATKAAKDEPQEKGA